jgi:hypothetical protein
MQIGKTNLIVTDVMHRKSQTSLFREEQGQTVSLIAIKNTKTGETGHVYHELEVDKRDIVEENFYTDNPSLFDDEHPEADELQEACLSGDGGDCLCHSRDEWQHVIAACINGDTLGYRQGNPAGETYEEKQWGMYLE